MTAQTEMKNDFAESSGLRVVARAVSAATVRVMTAKYVYFALHRAT